MKINVCRSIAAKARGVIGRYALAADEVYVFPDTYEGQGFHMQTVPFDLDIAFLDRDYGILHVAHMAAEVGRATAPAESTMAVEAPAGYFEDHGLAVDQVWQEIATRAQRGEI